MLRRLLLICAVLLAGCTTSPGLDQFQPNPDQADCHFPEAPTGDGTFLVGGITDDDGQPLANVTVTASLATESIHALTNANGCFFLSLTEGGTYSVRFSLPGYQTVERRGVAVDAGEVNIFDQQLNRF